jgi:hypothetical protein
MEQRFAPTLQMKMLDKRQIGAYPIPMGHGEISVEPVAGEGRR